MPNQEVQDRFTDWIQDYNKNGKRPEDKEAIIKSAERHAALSGEEWFVAEVKARLAA